MLTKTQLPACPVATIVELIGNKWKLLIIRNLLVSTSRFGELKNGIPGISQKVLTDNLRNLESDGLILRKVYAEVPPRVEYSLSELGNTLRPLFKDMEAWGNSYKEFISNHEFSNIKTD
jgi:DNA-binding HxlR family transcriptional regulator